MAWLDSAHQKLTRADEHLRSLEMDMREKLGAKKYGIAQKAQAEITDVGSHTTVGDAHFIDPPDLPGEWAFLIGDFAHNARAALDHLAWDLASRNHWRAQRVRKLREPWPPENTQFPVVAYFRKPSDKKRHEAQLAHLFRPADRKLVAGAQPYKRGNLAKAQPLWLLHRVRNTDAHRALHTVLATIPTSVLGDSTHRVVALGNAPKLPTYLDVIEDVFEKVNPGDTVELTVQVQANFAPYVTFDQRGADFDGQEVLPLLYRCRAEVERILGLF